MSQRRRPPVPTGFRRRTAVTAKLATRVAWKFARRKLSASPRHGGKNSLADAVALAEELGTMKGLVMKLGQIASYLPGAASADSQRVLQRLQAHAEPMAFDEVAHVVRAELGGDVASLFDAFEPTPLAAASIGQVHRARLDGRELAVKVQYPGIEAAIEEDLASLSVIARLGTMGVPIDAKALVAELRERALGECDYREEALNQIAFSGLLAGIDGARVPGVVLKRSARRVLATDLDDGLDLNAFCETASQKAKDRAGETLFAACFSTIFHRCVYNADPHPGNYLFHRDGGVTFLDFGCVRRFEPLMIDRWKRLAYAVLEGDRPRFERELTDLGFVPNPRRFDWEHQWRAFRHVYQPFLTPGRFAVTPAYLEQTYDLLIFRNPNAMRTAMPPEWLMLNRLQWGLNAVIVSLGAKGRWSELFRAALESKTEPAAPPLLAAGEARP